MRIIAILLAGSHNRSDAPSHQHGYIWSIYRTSIIIIIIRKACSAMLLASISAFIIMMCMSGDAMLPAIIS